MTAVLVIGGGLAGCTAALELARSNINVIIVEKLAAIGGKVRSYGCKATDRCNRCGLCLVGDLWRQVEEHENIKILTQARVIDIMGSRGAFTVVVKSAGRIDNISGISDIVVAAGFDEFAVLSAGGLEYEAAEHIITGSYLEQLLADRGKNEIFSDPPASVGFIQCFGSRDIQEKAAYCSRVCCGYSVRAAKVLREYYPDLKITFFYMDLQELEGQDCFDALFKENMEFVRCRPVSVKAGKPNIIVYEDPEEGRIVERRVDLLVLSEGIYPSEDFEDLAEICMLALNENGFMSYIKDPRQSGIYLAGCVAGPKRIEEVYAESLQVAREICGGIV